MAEMKELSVIIPVYNTPIDMLERCFASVLKLRDISFEVLLIDDGSGGETAQFCKNFADKQASFRYIPKENGGVSSARNMGIAKAEGTYITFVDADDCLLPDAFSPAYFQADADLIIFDTAVEEKCRRAVWKGLEMPAGKVEKTDVLRRYVCGVALNGPYAKLYKTARIRSADLRFNENFVTAEDWLFGCSFALQAEKIRYVDTAAYLYYRDSGTSLSRLSRFPDTMLENHIAMYRKKLEILQDTFSDAPDAAQLRGAAAAAVVENMFNCAADLHLMKKLTPRRKENIRDICRQAKAHLSLSAWKKACLKAMVLTRFWVALYPLARLRAVYMKRKK